MWCVCLIKIVILKTHNKMFWLRNLKKKRSLFTSDFSGPPNQLLHCIKSILYYEEVGPFPMKEMDLKFNKIIIFSNHLKILEIRKCYLMALMLTIVIP